MAKKKKKTIITIAVILGVLIEIGSCYYLIKDIIKDVNERKEPNNQAVVCYLEKI